MELQSEQEDRGFEHRLWVSLCACSYLSQRCVCKSVYSFCVSVLFSVALIVSGKGTKDRKGMRRERRKGNEQVTLV